MSWTQYRSSRGMSRWHDLVDWVGGYPFEVALSGSPPSAALADQVKSLDWRKRAATKKGSATRAEVVLIRAKLRSLIGT